MYKRIKCSISDHILIQNIHKYIMQIKKNYDITRAPPDQQ